MQSERSEESTAVLRQGRLSLPSSVALPEGAAVWERRSRNSRCVDGSGGEGVVVFDFWQVESANPRGFCIRPAGTAGRKLPFTGS